MTARVSTPCPSLVFQTPLPGQLPEPPLSSMFPKQKRHVVVRALQETAMTSKRITSKRRGREDGLTVSPKKLKLSLAVGKRNLNLDPENLGLVSVVQEEANSGHVKRKRGRLVGSKNKLPYGDKQQTSKYGEGNEKKRSPEKGNMAKQSMGKSSSSKGKELVVV